jgi:hypothetical protein
MTASAIRRPTSAVSIDPNDPLVRLVGLDNWPAFLTELDRRAAEDATFDFEAELDAICAELESAAPKPPSR